jgi:TorA maturation chaperone TorD
MNDPLLREWIWERLAKIFDGDVEPLPAPPEGVNAISGPIRRRLEALRTAITEADPDEACADHVRLFVTARDGVPAPPYESWYIDGELLGPSTRRVEEMYAAHGLARAEEGGEPADYLSTELEFLYFLARHELAARAVGDREALLAVCDAQNRFVHAHLGRWIPAFVRQTRAAHPGSVYAAAIDLLETVLTAGHATPTDCRQ